MTSNNQPMDEEQALREFEAYLQTHNIQQTLKDCIVQLCVNRPENPMRFLGDWFQKLARACFQKLGEPSLNKKESIEETNPQ